MVRNDSPLRVGRVCKTQIAALGGYNSRARYTILLHMCNMYVHSTREQRVLVTPPQCKTW